MPDHFTLAACAEFLWPDKPMPWRCSRLAEMGFQAAFWNWTSHDVDAMAASGAEFAIMNGFLGGNLVDDEGADEMLRTARETAEVGKRLNCARLCLTGADLLDGGSPRRPYPEVTDAHRTKARDTLQRIADLADELDVVFALENLNVTVDHPGVPFYRAEDTIALVSEIDRPGLVLNLDLYHAQIEEGNLIETCRKALPWIGEVQVADVPGRFEPGTGEINFNGIARALKEMGYAGTVTLESNCSGTSEDALEAFRAAFTV
ncbi:TIM barrel protein [Pelagovum pacificum]|uniref:TIM barrel protein n=1 Tax=Pelagovum pacificum TaxID=2588711 RepID=A0A5C5G967_9RHOB|nr:TIM barrel protein [Pelagovum pacificum]QQA42172.1 TIM barrel protein [Pelagovum pacificum]TNY31258.1 TIM barrel protein [Pelagovum pacificum]